MFNPGPTRIDFSDTHNGMFGHMSTSGDVNGDSYVDLFISAPNADGDVAGEGRTFGLYGSPQGLGATPDWSAEPADLAGAYFGEEIAFLGDVHGDGFGDLLVTAPSLSRGVGRPGALFLYSGGAQGLTGPATLFPPNPAIHKLLGEYAAGPGDTNGDGYADVAVSRATAGADNAETVVVYHGSPQGLIDPIDLLGPRGETRLPREAIGDVASAGDVDGDGYMDLLVILSNYRDIRGVRGVASVYHGSASGIERTPRWVSDIVTDSLRSITNGAGVGDVNGDGYDDIMIGDPFASGDLGKAWLFMGGAGGLGAAAAWTRAGGTRDYFGGSIAAAGDVNADGYGDVLVGAPACTNGGFITDMGCAWLFAGSAGGLLSEPTWQTGVPSHESWQVLFGSSLGPAGDVDGDGFDDIVVGAEQGQGDFSANEGSAWLFTSEPEPVDQPGNTVDEDQDGLIACFADRDGDGLAGHASLVLSADGDCSDAGEALTQGTPDCNDHEASVHPGAVEVVGNNLDEDCDGQNLCYVDADGDLRTSGAVVLSPNADCRDRGEVITGPDDCNDQDPGAGAIAPEEAGDEDDEDCDGRVLCYVDTDLDGFSSGATTLSLDADCSDAGELITATTADCDDADDATWPGARELPWAPADENCDGVHGPNLQARWLSARQLEITTSGGYPGASLVLTRSFAGAGAGPCPPQLNGDCSDLLAPTVVPPSRPPDALGEARWVFNLPAGLQGRRAWWQVWNLGPGLAEATPVVMTEVP